MVLKKQDLGIGKAENPKSGPYYRCDFIKSSKPHFPVAKMGISATMTLEIMVL